jgi:hypothetical protein
MKAAFSSPSVKRPKDLNSVDVDLNYLVSHDSRIKLDWFEMRDDYVADTPTRRAKGRILSGILLCVLVAFLILAFIGIVTVIGWVVRN